METSILLLLYEFLLFQSSSSSCELRPLTVPKPPVYHYDQWLNRYEPEELTEVHYDITCYDINHVSDIGNLYQCNPDRCSIMVFLNSHINTLEMINPTYKTGLSSLKSLYMNDSNIKNIRPGAFNGIWEMEQLHLENNQLTRISRGSFNTLIKLLWLSLESNEITSIEDEAFLGMSDLEYLNLGHNKLNHVTHVFDSLQNLKILCLSYNALKTITFGSELLALNELYLENTQLSTLDIENQTNISILDLRHNFLSCIPNLTNPIQLKIGNNSLETLDSGSLDNFLDLEVLDIHGNKFKSLPENLFQYTRNLTTLNISYNALTTLEFGLFNGLENMENLDVSNNKISLLHEESYFSLKSLRYLNVSNNKLQSIAIDKILASSQNLRKISFSGNELSCSQVFSILHDLKKFGRTFRHPIISYGPDRNSTNIHGFACINMESGKSLSQQNMTANGREFQNIFKDVLFEFLRNITELFERKQDGNVAIDTIDPIQLKRHEEKLAAIGNFFIGDFRNTSFYKFFEKFNNQLNDSSTIPYSEWKIFLHELISDWNQTKFYAEEELIKLIDEDFENSSLHKFFSNFTNIHMNYNETISVNSFIEKLQNYTKIGTESRTIPISRLKDNSDKIEKIANQITETNYALSGLEITILVFGCLFIILMLKDHLMKFVIERNDKQSSLTSEMPLM